MPDSIVAVGREMFKTNYLHFDIITITGQIALDTLGNPHALSFRRSEATKKSKIRRRENSMSQC